MTKVLEIPKGKNESDILKQIKPEIQSAIDLVTAKREIFRTNLLLFNNQLKASASASGKVGDDLLFRLIDTHMAVAYSNKPLVKFAGRNFAGADAAATLNRVAKFDFEEMDMEVVDWFTQFDRFMFGVGIKAIVGFDDERNVPIVKNYSTMNWLPDPHGFGSAANFRFMGWENDYTKADFEEDENYFDPKATAMLKPTKSTIDKQARRAAATLNQSGITYDEKTGEYVLIDWFTQIDGEKYFTTVDQKVSRIVRLRKIKAVTKKEKKDPSLIPFPVSLHYYFPMRDDPFGKSIPDFASDKQRARAMLKNLHLALAQAGLYPMYIYDKTQIRNRRSLDYEPGKMIGISGPVTDSIVRPVPRDPGDINSALTLEQQLDTDAENASGVNKNMQGGVSASGGTLGEQTQIQNNSNLRLLLRIAVDEWGEKDFWRLWRRMYQSNYTSGKEVPIDTAFGETFEAVESHTFASLEDPRIKIEGALQKKMQDNKDRAYYNALYPVITQDPNTPAISKTIAKRRLLKLNGVSEEDIYIMAPKSEEEILAENENILLAHGDDVEVNLNDDHDTHMVLHSQINTPEARNHILKHMQMKREMATQQTMNPGAGAVDTPQKNIAQQQIGSLASSEISQGNNGLQNVTANPDAGDMTSL